MQGREHSWLREWEDTEGLRPEEMQPAQGVQEASSIGHYVCGFPINKAAQG